MTQDIKWMEEVVVDVPSNKRLFKFFRFIIGKRKTGVTYKDLYIFYTNVYNIKGKHQHTNHDRRNQTGLKFNQIFSAFLSQ